MIGGCCCNVHLVPSHSVEWNAELSQELLETLGLPHQAQLSQIFPGGKKGLIFSQHNNNNMAVIT